MGGLWTDYGGNEEPAKRPSGPEVEKAAVEIGLMTADELAPNSGSLVASTVCATALSITDMLSERIMPKN